MNYRISVWIILSFPLFVSTSENLAREKPAKMSSMYDPATTGPELSVDGNLGTSFTTDGCSTSYPDDMAPWLIVDLLNTFNIHSVNITNTDDMFPERLHSFVIEVFKTNPTRYEDVESEICFNHTGAPVGSGETRSFPCVSSVTGRFVRITKWKMNDGDLLMICEVQVFGELLTGCAVTRNFSRSRGCRMMSNSSDTFVAQDLNLCLIKCIKHGECLEFNFNEKDHKCELLTHPRFEDLIQQDSLWDHYSSDLC